ncbi:hypothetical protein [Streptomyces sp. NPDC053720]|uniref:hypothetical protein n=1 Tax=Streptomyces sp. NPDC053720 TaxID=3154855 RepID=UPI00342D1287
MEELTRHVAWIGTANGHHWDGEARVVIDLLRAMPVGARSRLAALLPINHQDGTEASVLPRLIAEGLTLGAVDKARREMLEHYGRRYAVDAPEPLVWMAEAERAAGREVPEAAVAVIRRSALAAYCDPTPFNTLRATLTHPVLNPGETWADAALTHADTAGSAWHRLLRHTLTASSARPAAKWDKTARAVIDEIGPEKVRRAVVSWLSLVGSPRTRPFDREDALYDDTLDPYNVTALRGLAWLVPLLPPDPDTPQVLGMLVETSLRVAPNGGRRAPRVANAAVLAMTRDTGEAALAELERLSTHVTYKATLKQIEAALEDRKQRLPG